jgi:hypothetical protein
MNNKLYPGCMAMIIAGESIGKFVTCVKFVGQKPGWISKDLWLVDRDVRTFMACEEIGTGREVYRKEVEPEPYAPQSYLMPIGGNFKNTETHESNKKEFTGGD